MKKYITNKRPLPKKDTKPIRVRVCDLPDDIPVRVGMRIRSCKTPNKHGTVMRIDKGCNYRAWVKWDNSDTWINGFYHKECDCEVVGWDGISTIE